MLVESGLDLCLPDTIALFDVGLRGFVDIEATKLKPVFQAEGCQADHFKRYLILIARGQNSYRRLPIGLLGQANRERPCCPHCNDLASLATTGHNACELLALVEDILGGDFHATVVPGNGVDGTEVAVPVLLPGGGEGWRSIRLNINPKPDFI